MAKPLTSKSRVLGEQLRISQLTDAHKAYFKVIISHQVQKKYLFNSIQSGRLKDKQILKIYRALGAFLDESVKMTITEVEQTYGRKPYKTDRTFDPELGRDVPVQHLCLFKKDATPVKHVDSVRIHGYFRAAGGYFIITRLDWFHTVS